MEEYDFEDFLKLKIYNFSFNISIWLYRIVNDVSYVKESLHGYFWAQFQKTYNFLFLYTSLRISSVA
jgi:hypothetical protein